MTTTEQRPLNVNGTLRRGRPRTRGKTTRRMTTQIARRPWRRQITDSLGGGLAMQMFAHLAKKLAAHGRSHIRDAVVYVRKGKGNNFD